MPKLRRIRNHVELVVPEEVRALDDPRPVVTVDEAMHTEVVRDDLGLEGVDQLVERIMQRHERYDTGMDAAMTVELHRLLPLSRREAADRRLWSWLGWVRYPHFVAWRWKPSGMAGLRTGNRFVGNRVRQTFSRLWWAAELTVRPGEDYSVTGQLIGLSGFQDVYEAIFGRAFCQYHPALEAFIRVVGGKPEKIVRKTARELGFLLTTLVLESMTDSDLDSALSDLVEAVEAGS